VSLHLLLVEDDALIARLYALKLESAGHVVTVAADGRRGWQSARRGASDIDLVLLDIELPGLDGVQVLERVRREPSTRHLPVLILSNHRERTVVERCRHLGIVDWRQKSATTPGELLRALERWRTGRDAPSPLPAR
jgi:CheY-like chemotaxis protein